MPTSPSPNVALTTLGGGPSVIMELGETRFLVDPTFDNAGDYGADHDSGR